MSAKQLEFSFFADSAESRDGRVLRKRPALPSLIPFRCVTLNNDLLARRRTHAHERLP